MGLGKVLEPRLELGTPATQWRYKRLLSSTLKKNLTDPKLLNNSVYKMKKYVGADSLVGSAPTHFFFFNTLSFKRLGSVRFF